MIAGLYQHSIMAAPINKVHTKLFTSLSPSKPVINNVPYA